MTAVPTFNALADEQFVSLTTFRRDGTPVPTPVWIACGRRERVILRITLTTPTP